MEVCIFEIHRNGASWYSTNTSERERLWYASSAKSTFLHEMSPEISHTVGMKMPKSTVNLMYLRSFLIDLKSFGVWSAWNFLIIDTAAEISSLLQVDKYINDPKICLKGTFTFLDAQIQ